MSIQSDNKRLTKNTIMLYFRMIITMVVSFYTSRVVLNALGVVDYGIYNVVGGIVGTLSVLNGAMAGTTQRWITIALGKSNTEYLKEVFGVGLTSQMIIALIIVILTETIGLWYLYNYAVIPAERLNASFWVFQISTITLLLNIINVPFLGSIIAHEKMGAFSFFSITDVLMKLLICFTIDNAVIDKLILYSSLLMVAYIINFICMQVYCKKKFIEARFNFRWNKNMYKEMWSLTFWTMFGHISLVGYTQGITLLINMFFGPSLNAAYSIAVQGSNIINQFSSSFQTAINPQITKTYAIGDLNTMHKLMYRSAKFSYFLMLFIAIPLFYEASFLLSLWLKNTPEYSVLFMRYMIFISMLVSIRNPLVTAAIANGNLKRYQIVVNGTLLLVCPITYVCYKINQPVESANIILLILMFLAVIESSYMLRNMISFNFKDFFLLVLIPLLKVTVTVLSITGFVYLIVDEGWTRLILITLISSISILLAIYLLGLSYIEKKFIITSLLNYFKK